MTVRRSRASRALVLVLVLAVSTCAPPEEDGPARSGATESAATAPAASAPRLRRYHRNVLSPVYSIDRVYKSMQGPMSRWETLLADGYEQPELLWLTGFATTIVAPNGLTTLSQEFMCHSNLDLNHDVQSELLGITAPSRIGARLATISQGLESITVPAGFGIPFPSVQPMLVTSQVLNHNVDPADLDPPLQVRHRVELTYLRDRDLAPPLQPPKPLYAAGISVMVSLADAGAYFDTLDPSEVQHGAGCSPGAAAAEGAAHLFIDRHDQRFTAHWIVKPGREVRRTLVTGMLSLDYDTTIHQIAIHVHPFAESLTLRDLTTGEDIFVSRVRNAPGTIGLESVDSFSSAEGIPVFKDHEYELVSVYDNTSGEDQDAMAVMYLFLADKTFDRARAIESLAGLERRIATMDAPSYQRWVQDLRRSAALAQ